MASSRPYNTFKVDHQLGEILRIENIKDLRRVLLRCADPIIVGGGSNVLFISDTKRPLIVIDLKGIRILSEDPENVLIEVCAGEIWHDFVLWAIDNGFGGIENLSLIPGKCGAAPMQNIGAYGVELSQVLKNVVCLDRSNGEEIIFNKDNCHLAYRDSIFKGAFKDLYVIVSVRLSLTKSPFHNINTSYGGIKNTLADRGILEPSIKDVSDAVIKIRNSKLPDPDLLPNAGSFFKNPVIPISQYNVLKSRFSNMPSYPFSEETCKIPAGWLIDQCGWKGIMVGDVGVHNRQALVIVNHGTSDGQEILALSKQIQKTVSERYGIQLQPEVNIID